MDKVTPYEAWLRSTTALESAQCFIDFGFYFMIGAALQRRIWHGQKVEPWCPNTYTVFVGPPASGKSRVCKKVGAMLDHHIRPPSKLSLPSVDEKHPLYKLFPSLGQSMTVEAFIDRLTKLGDTYHYTTTKGDGSIVTRPYVHASAYTCLNEFTLLFNRHAETINKFLCDAYDCDKFIKITKKDGVQIVNKMCVSMLACCTPEDFADIIRAKAVEGGLASRFLVVYAQHPRKRVLESFVTDEELAYNDVVHAHLEKLANCYGEVTFSDAAKEHLRKWYEVDQMDFNRAVTNKSPLLEGYYNRAKNHVYKMAMCLHFADQVESYEIQLPTVIKAMRVLSEVEKDMHLAYQRGGRNEIHDVTFKIIAHIEKYGPQSYRDLLLAFNRDVNRTELNELLQHMKECGKLKQTKVDQVVHWQLASK